MGAGLKGRGMVERRVEQDNRGNARSARATKGPWMPIEPRWILSTPASSLHAASVLLGGHSAPARQVLLDANTWESLAPAVESLAGDLAAVGLEPAIFFDHAIALAARFDAPLKWAEVLVLKTLGPRTAPEQIAARLARSRIALETAFARAQPRLLEELELRSEPLRLQWEARGPGLMKGVGRLFDPGLVVEQADVILVQPVLGGGGGAHPPYNSIHVEAVLTNPVAELPEVVRLGWLWAQLNLDLPEFQDALRRDRLHQLGRLALIPAVLAAAEEVELARFDEAALATALSAWHVSGAQSSQLLEWWQTRQATAAPWNVALGALDRMLD
jgi:hypothetical protein